MGSLITQRQAASLGWWCFSAPCGCGDILKSWTPARTGDADPWRFTPLPASCKNTTFSCQNMWWRLMWPSFWMLWDKVWSCWEYLCSSLDDQKPRLRPVGQFTICLGTTMEAYKGLGDCWCRHVALGLDPNQFLSAMTDFVKTQFSESHDMIHHKYVYCILYRMTNYDLPQIDKPTYFWYCWCSSSNFPTNQDCVSLSFWPSCSELVVLV